MYGIFTNIYPINEPNVGKYTIHGAYGLQSSLLSASLLMHHCGMAVHLLDLAGDDLALVGLFLQDVLRSRQLYEL